MDVHTEGIGHLYSFRAEGRKASEAMFVMKDLPDGTVLPRPLARTRRGGGSRDDFSVCLRTVTPILGGSAQPRASDEIDVIRTPTIRGHLRFWWRALHAHHFSDPGKLYEEEARIWGRASGRASSGRSPVELRAEILTRSAIDKRDIGSNHPDAYALWPARGTPPAPRREPGLEFRLTVSAPSKEVLPQVKDAVRLWILFGGYGSRTRRGLGALTVCDDSKKWLPAVNEAEHEAGLPVLCLDRLMKSSNNGIFRAPADWKPSPVPVLAGATMLVAPHRSCDGLKAWRTALHCLRDFRQGSTEDGRPARNRRRGRSDWPEADTVRHLTRRPRPSDPPHAHAPRRQHQTPPPRWPRAGFGLPIEIRFAPRDQSFEPPSVQLLWRDEKEKERDRLASPLIVKPLPVDGGFLPMALWLNRADPEGDVFAKGQNVPRRASQAVVGSFNAPLFVPAAGKTSLRDAFCGWLETEHNWTRLP